MMRRIVAAALLAASLLGPAAAQTWPAKPLRILVPYPPGGGTDLVARAIGQKLSESLKQPVVIENKPGGNTIIGTAQLAQSAPDGYTIGLITDAHSGNAASGKSLPYDSDNDFVPIVQLLRVSFMLIANSQQVPQRTLPDLVKYANANPGWLSFGSLGPGSPHDVAMAWFKSMAKLEVLVVPYRGIGPALQDTVAGHVKTMNVGVGVADEMIKAGKVHPIAVTSAKRLASAPDVPTVAEQGWPEYEFVTWYGLVLPKGTPADIAERLNREVNAALKEPDVSARIAQAGGEIVGGSAAMLMDTYRRDVAKYRKIFEVTGIKLD